MDEPECTVRLPERRRLTASSHTTRSDESTVHCPLSQGARPVEHCLRCGRFEREVAAGGHAYLECHVPASLADPHDLCGELMSHEVTCLDSELEASKAVEFLETAGVTSAPVLDDNSVLIGVVSTMSLTRMRLETAGHHGFGYGAAPLEVEDAMSTEVVTLTQQATIGEAARLMASRDLDRVPIVTDDGHLVGVLSAMDLVRWLSKRLY